MFSRTRSVFLVPGMGTMCGDFGQQPGERDLSWGCFLALGDLFHEVDDGLVGFEGFGSEAGKPAADVLVGEGLVATAAASEKALTER
jgi:hypothetical protein